ncbi:MAG: cation:proton antiporter [Pseudomonadota bacterium]
MPEFSPTPMEFLFWEALALIVAACIFAPIFRKLGFGTILGYLVAGVAVKLTLSTGLADHPEELLHFAEFGVVLFLFVIGLEINPKALWQMRGDIFGLGLAQVGITGIAIAAIVLALGYSWQTSLITGLGLALSSTALTMRALDEKRERATTHGRKIFAILLFQDLAIVPLLLLATFLAPLQDAISLGETLTQLGVAVGAIAFLIVLGRFALNPMLDLLSRANMHEIMTAAALGIVIFAALMMDLAGMSYAMGAFIAGVLLADSNFKHEIEANVEPFRGLFLGLFFMAVGLSLNLEAIFAQWQLIVIAAPTLMIIKAATLYLIARLGRTNHIVSTKTSIALAQAGEFGFVLFGATAATGLHLASEASTLIAIVTLSMALSPLFDRLDKILAPKAGADTINESFEDAAGRALVIGFGRFGQLTAQPLLAQGIDVTILDYDANRVREAGTFGFRIHYGDGTRRDVLRAAGADRADLIIVCVDDPASANDIVDLAQQFFRNAKVLVRSIDRQHSIELARRQVDYSIRELMESSFVMGEQALIHLGIDQRVAAKTVEDTRRRDTERLAAQIDGDTRSGIDNLHTKPVKPEPLVTPVS